MRINASGRMLNNFKTLRRYDLYAPVIRLEASSVCQFRHPRCSQVTDDIADIFAAPNGRIARTRLKQYVEKYAESAPELSEWMKENLLEGLTVFELPTEHRKRIRTTNSLERLHEEINRRTRVARLFPNEASLIRLVSAIEMEISEDWIAGKRYLNMNVEMENGSKFANSSKKKIYRKNVA